MADAPDAKRPKLEDAAEEEVKEEEQEEEEEEPLDEAELDDDPAEAALTASLIDQLGKIQEELETINDDASDKVLQVEQEYNFIRRPVYVRRREIISQIDGFWKRTLLAHPIVSGYINDQDEDMLDHLQEVVVEENDDIRSGFKIVFRFSDNPYFENAELVKNFHYHVEGLRTSSTPPVWRAPFDPREENGEEDDPETHNPQRPLIRFFTWFVAEEAHEPGSHDELADTIRDDIWPNPFKYYMHGHTQPGVEDEDDEDEAPGEFEEADVESEGDEGEDEGALGAGGPAMEEGLEEDDDIGPDGQPVPWTDGDAGAHDIE